MEGRVSGDFEKDRMPAYAGSHGDSLTLLRMVIDHCPVAMAVFMGSEHRYVLANRAYCKVRGEAESSLLGRRFVDVFPKGASDGRLAALDQVYQSGNAMRLEDYPWPALDGQLRYYDIDIKPICLQPGGPVDGLLAVASDVSEKVLGRLRAVAERERRAASLKADMQILMDAVPAYIFLTHDPNCDTLVGNRAANVMFNLPPGSNLSLKGRERPPGFLRIFKGDQELSQEDLPIQKAARGEEQWGEELELRFEDGQVRHIFGNAVPLADDSGRASGAVAAFIDITDRRMAEMQVAESEERFRTLFEMAPLSVMVVDAHTGLMAEFNDKAHVIHGYTREEFAHLSMQDLVFPWTAEHVVRMRRIGRSPALSQFETQHRCKDGSLIDLLVVARGVRLKGHSFLQEMHLDITELKKVQRELASAKVSAERANEAKSLFLAAASHDLRQPLQALALYIEVLQGRLGTDHASVMHNIERCLSSLGEFLDDLLDLSKLDAGVVKPNFSDCALAAVVDKVVAAYSPEAGKKGLRLSSVHTSLRAWTDQVLFERILSNLISNAVRYTEAGGVVVGCRRRQDRVWVEVWDSGIGITQDKTNEIFEEFRQLGNPERSRDKGSGLGLAIVRKTAALLKAEIRVLSRPAKGSLFAVSLPLVTP